MSDPSVAASRRRRGFTLVELLVVIAVIGLLVVLVMPAIQSPRSNPFRSSCRNNMKQLGLALQNHHDTYRTFPPLMFTSMPGEKGDLDVQNAATADRRYSYMVRLLPFMEEDALYKSLSKVSAKFTISADDPRVLVANPLTGNGTVSPAGIRINGLICPEYSGETESGNQSATNYFALVATTEGKLTPRGTFDADDAQNTQAWNVAPDGMIVPDRAGKGQPMSRMSDGTTKTCVMVESREGVIVGKSPTMQTAWYKSSQGYVYAFPPSQSPGANDVRFIDGTFTVGVKTALNYGPWPKSPNVVYKSGASPGSALRNFGPSSDHPDGIVVHAMGDGSVQEIVDTVDPGAYYAATTVAGNENVPSPWGN